MGGVLQRHYDGAVLNLHTAPLEADQIDLIPRVGDLVVRPSLAIVRNSTAAWFLCCEMQPLSVARELVELRSLRLGRSNVDLCAGNRPIVSDTAFDHLEFLSLHP